MIRRLIRLIGSIKLAVILLIVIAAVLAWGTIYEARFGTAAVQRFVYYSWWFQLLLAFLALNLFSAAIQRYPWKSRQIPFLLAHLGVILILLGGIIGSLFGIEGHLIIGEGQSERALRLPGNVLVVHEQGDSRPHVFQTNFEARAWMHEPNTRFDLHLADRSIALVVDRYYPDALLNEEITHEGNIDNPAVHVRLNYDKHQDTVWFFSRDPQRFGIGWMDAHVLFLEVADAQELAQLIGPSKASANPRGVVSIAIPGADQARKVPVPEVLGEPLEIDETPYTIVFTKYYADFAITDQGPVSRSSEPNNPAVAFTLSGPEGTDTYLLFALHPDFAAVHGQEHTIKANVSYTRGDIRSVPADSIGLIRAPSGKLAALLTGGALGERKYIDRIDLGKGYSHPWLGYEFTVVDYYPRAKVTQKMVNRGNEVRSQALHILAHEDGETKGSWVSIGDSAAFSLGTRPFTVTYRPDQMDLPFSVKLLDFRKIDYPGTQMAAGFESDVELSDPKRGLMLMRTISMNEPLRYGGFSLFQSSYIPSPVEASVLSVRSDPGTPFVYAGFIIVIVGVIAMFIIRSSAFTRWSRKG